ncbi:phage tail protein [Pseudomonas nitroreducens]|uniref:phage tail protein n=1 Tax=Pseudomonas nitroreducens TaxID=46680 RepID=UPI001FB66ABE|nr:phage tail protein [Pseudomonas nitroreducens]MCJ1878579.1 phage tail protein [Pseudomonas nitroreducens]MCJ1896607.1 phage tail protein [Pseudomonas nitroreducens]
MAVTYYALLTTIGAGKLANATALGTSLKITQLAVGDGGGNVPTPDASRTNLVNEVRRAPLNRLSVDPANSSQIIAEQVIPEDVGGWWIREMGLYDEVGALIAYANCAPSYKPQLAEGSGRTQTVRIVLIVSNAASVELKIDPSVVLATREYVDNSIVTALNRLDCKQSVRVATTTSITLSGLQSLDGISLVAGDRVLVKNQGNAADNGIYISAATAWKRSTDADDSSEVTPGLTVVVESGISQADSIWQLVTDGVIVLGTTELAFQNITNGLARLASPAFAGNPTAPTPVQFDSDTSLATTEFVQRALGNFAGQASINTSTTLTAAHAGLIINAGGTITLTLPLGASVLVGATYKINNAGAGAVTLQASSGNNLFAIGNGTARSFTLQSGDELTVAYVGGTSWYAWGGAQLGLSAGFGASLGNPGWRRLPTGEMEQWGTLGLAAVGNYNQQSIGGTVFYTNYYNLAYPLAFLIGVYEAQVTLACSTYATQIGMAGNAASLNLSGTGNPLTGLTIAITTPTLGYAPTVHWRARGR